MPIQQIYFARGLTKQLRFLWGLSIWHQSCSDHWNLLIIHYTFEYIYMQRLTYALWNLEVVLPLSLNALSLPSLQLSKKQLDWQCQPSEILKKAKSVFVPPTYSMNLFYLTDFISGYKNALFALSSELYHELLSMPYQEKVCSLTIESLKDAYNIRYPSSVIQIALSSPRSSSIKQTFYLNKLSNQNLMKPTFI